ncbi:hypothetical protein BRC2024_OFSGVTRC_CDS_0048 [Acinetobacter phage vB_AbaM_Rocket]
MGIPVFPLKISKVIMPSKNFFRPDRQAQKSPRQSMGNFSQFIRHFHEPPSRCWKCVALRLPIFRSVTPI